MLRSVSAESKPGGGGGGPAHAFVKERREQSWGFPHHLPSSCCQEDDLKGNLAALAGLPQDSTEMRESEYVKMQPFAGTDKEITVALRLLELCSVIGKTEAHRMDTC